MIEHRIRVKLPPRNARIVSPTEPLPPTVLPTAPPTRKPPSGHGESNAAAEAALREQQRQLSADREFIEATLSTIAQNVQELRDTHDQAIVDLRQLAVEIGVVVAGRLFCRELESDRLEIENMVRQTVAETVDDQPVVIRLNPKDLHLMQRRLGNRLLFPDTDWAPKMMPDNAVARGSCLIEGKQGSYAGDPAAEFSKMREELIERMHHARS